MLIRLMLVLILAGLMAGATLWLVFNPGTISMDWMGWQVETTMLILLLALLLFLMLIATVSAVIRFLFSLGKRRARSQMARRIKDLEAGVSALIAALEAASAGQIREGRRLGAEAARQLQSRELAKHLAAFMPLPLAETIDVPTMGTGTPQVLESGGAQNRALRQWWQRLFLVGQAAPSRSLRSRFAARLPAPSVPSSSSNLPSGRAVEAVPMPNTASPRMTENASPELAAKVKAGDWEAAAALIQEKTPGGAHLKATLKLAQAMALGPSDAAAALARAQEALENDPPFMPAALLVARLLDGRGESDKAIQILEATWRQVPGYPLVSLYFDLSKNRDPQEFLIAVEAFVADRAGHPESQLALGEAATNAMAWGRARRHLIASLKRQPSSKAYTLLARIEDEEAGDQAAAERWRHKAKDLLSDYGWYCQRCGTGMPDWAPLCPSCTGVGTVAWGVTHTRKAAPSQSVEGENAAPATIAMATD